MSVDMSARAAAPQNGKGSVKTEPTGFLASLSESQLRLLGMIGVLLVIWVAFQFLSGGLFLNPRNLTNLSGQVAITALLAGGMVMVMIPGYIDLSVGATVSGSAVIAAIASHNFGLSFWPVVTVTLVFGLLIGVWHAIWIAWLQVPAFIVTLATSLALRGFILIITGAESISPNMDILVISDGSLPTPLGIAVVLFIWFAFAALQLRELRARQAAGIMASFLSTVGLPVSFGAIFAVAAAFISSSYRGISLPIVIVLATVVIASGILRYTAFGRRLYAIGGNRQAAMLAGINIRLQGSLVLIGMGLLYGLAGLILVARLDSAPPDAESGLELGVIAAAVIGGTSLLGGRGTVGGAILGALLMESLSNGMSLINLPSAYQAVTVGLVVLLAVYVDIYSRGRRNRSEF
jgi:ABC-type xylose transport system permease subunit